MITIDPVQFKAWQIDHYAERLSEATTVEEKSFLRRELFNLKKIADGTTTDRRPNSLLGVQTNLER